MVVVQFIIAELRLAQQEAKNYSNTPNSTNKRS
jgi:hypothetical protein